MDLTTILTTIWLVHRSTPKCEVPIFKENRTSEDVGGHAADVWGKGVAGSNLASPTVILPSQRNSLPKRRNPKKALDDNGDDNARELTTTG
jgi:hypothetical protein